MSDLALGVDIGGSFVKMGLVDRDGEIKNSSQTPTPQSPPAIAISILIDDIVDFLDEAGCNLASLAGIGVGFPGAIRRPKGRVEAAPNLKAWNGTELRGIFEKELGRRVAIDNDANLAALAEYVWGNGKGANPLILFTLGTGIGGGIILDGRIFHGAWGGAAELGHQTIEFDGKLCGCGNRGCLEAYAGTKGIVSRAWELLREDRGSLLWEMMGGDYGSLNPEIIGNAARDGDAVALKVTSETASALGVATANMMNILNPECILFGGGVAGWGEDILLSKIRKEARFRAIKSHFSSCRLDFAKAGALSGVIGAAVLAFEQNE